MESDTRAQGGSESAKSTSPSSSECKKNTHQELISDLTSYLWLPSDNMIGNLDSNIDAQTQNAFITISNYFWENELFSDEANWWTINRYIGEVKSSMGWSQYTAEENDIIERWCS